MIQWSSLKYFLQTSIKHLPAILDYLQRVPFLAKFGVLPFGHHGGCYVWNGGKVVLVVERNLLRHHRRRDLRCALRARQVSNENLGIFKSHLNLSCGFKYILIFTPKIVEMIQIDLRIFFKLGWNWNHQLVILRIDLFGHLYIKWVVAWFLLNAFFDLRSFGLGDDILAKLYGGVIRSHLKDYDSVISQPKPFLLERERKIIWNYSTTLKAYSCIPKTSGNFTFRSQGIWQLGGLFTPSRIGTRIYMECMNNEALVR